MPGGHAARARLARLDSRRVAGLAAAGLPDKQVAGQLYLSVYTVEAHLRGACAKLGVRSRSQLARRLGGSV